MWIQKNIQFVISRDDKIRLSVAIVYLIILPVLWKLQYFFALQDIEQVNTNTKGTWLLFSKE